MNKIKKLGMSFVYAARGIIYCIRHERNLRIHVVAHLYVLFFSSFYEFTKAEYGVLLLTCVVVIGLELLNTAIEVVIDKVSPHFSMFAMVGKDIAAGAVLVGAIGAVIVGIILFWDISVFKEIFTYFISEIYRPLILAISLIISVFFIKDTKKRGGSINKKLKEKD